MKNIIILLLATVICAGYISADDSFYYYRGQKIQLTKTGQMRKMTVQDTGGSGEMNLPCYISEGTGEMVPNGYINVKLKTRDNYSALEELGKQMGFEILEENGFMPLWFNLCLTDKASGNSIEIANAIYETGIAEASSPSFSMDSREISYDPDVYEQWGLYNPSGIDISVSEAWNYATGRGIKVAVIDQGIDLNHIDLVENLYPLSYDSETGTSPSIRYDYHGTHCAGIIAAVRNNGKLISGVAPDSKLMSISHRLDTLSVNPELKMANAINWAWQNGADVLSCSWSSGQNDLIADAIDNALKRGRQGIGCVIVTSAGNRGETDTRITFPGNYSEDVLAVSNITKDGLLHKASSWGESLFICAPGTEILSTMPGGYIANKTGTSMACPHVSGVAALILERNPKLSPKQVREIMARNAKKIGTEPYSTYKEFGSWNNKYGYGLIDAYQSVLNTPRSNN